MNKIQFKIYSADANFCHKRGWNDYFEPFCSESTNRIHHYINNRMDKPEGRKSQRLFNGYKLLFPDCYLTFELWNDIRNIKDERIDINLDGKQLGGTLRDVSSQIIRMIYRFNEYTKSEIRNKIEQLDLPSEYVGFHIRLGDKIIEHKLLDIETYISKAEEKTSIRKGFIFTDDFSVFEEICARYPNWEFKTFTKPKAKGYFHLEFIKLSSEKKRESIVNMLASMEVLSDAKHIICTYSSNPGMFLGMRVGEKVHGVDFEDWVVW